MNTSEAGYLLDEIYRGFSVVSRSHDRPCFVRWDRRKPSTLDNVVVMTVNEADRHDALWKDAMDKGEDLDLRSVYGDEVVDLVKRRVAEMEREKVWR